jgi:hypothetical protein
MSGKSRRTLHNNTKDLKQKLGRLQEKNKQLKSLLDYWRIEYTSRRATREVEPSDFTPSAKDDKTHNAPLWAKGTLGDLQSKVGKLASENPRLREEMLFFYRSAEALKDEENISARVVADNVEAHNNKTLLQDQAEILGPYTLTTSESAETTSESAEAKEEKAVLLGQDALQGLSWVSTGGQNQLAERGIETPSASLSQSSLSSSSNVVKSDQQAQSETDAISQSSRSSIITMLKFSLSEETNMPLKKQGKTTLVTDALKPKGPELEPIRLNQHRRVLLILGAILAILGNVITLIAAGISYLVQSKQRRELALNAHHGQKKPLITESVSAPFSAQPSSITFLEQPKGDFIRFCRTMGTEGLPDYEVVTSNKVRL